MKKHYFAIFAIFYSIQFFPQGDYLGKLIQEPLEEKFRVRAHYDLSQQQKDSLNKKIEEVKLKNAEKIFTYAIQVIDNREYLSQLGQDPRSIYAMKIAGQNKVANPQLADYVFSYDIKKGEVFFDGVEKGSSYSTYSGWNYNAKGSFQFEVCFKNIIKQASSACDDIGTTEYVTTTSTNPNTAEHNWKTQETYAQGGRALVNLIRDHFFEYTKPLRLSIPSDKVNTESFELFLYFFKAKGNKKHLKSKSDGLAKEVRRIIGSNYSYYRKHSCNRSGSEEDVINCLTSAKNELENDRKKLQEAMQFWKNEIKNKYYSKGKKSTIRSVMATNLLTTAYLLNSNENISFAMGVLKDEKGKNSCYDNVKNEAPFFTKKPYYVIPNYYKVNYAKKGKIIRGSDYKLEH